MRTSVSRQVRVLFSAAMIFLITGALVGFNLAVIPNKADAAQAAPEGPASEPGPMVLEETITYVGQYFSKVPGIYATASVDGSATIEAAPNALDFGLAVDVYTVGEGVSPEMVAGTLCEGAWTRVDNIDVDYDNQHDGVIAGCRTENVLVHYGGYLTFPTSGSYSFLALADDGFWMSLDGVPVITDDYSDKPRSGQIYSGIQIEAGHAYAFEAWYYENHSFGNVTLYAGLDSNNLQVISGDYFTNKGSTIKLPRTISLSAAGSDNWFAGDPLQLSSNLSGGGGQVSYSVLSGPCSIDDSYRVTASTPGQACTVQVLANGDDVYQDASDSIVIQAQAKPMLAIDPVISTKPATSSISYGQLLSASVLSGGVANASGTFSFADPTALLLPGARLVDVLFTPNDLTAYNVVTVRVTVSVNKAARTISLSADPGTWRYGENLRVKATPSAGAGSVVYSLDSSSSLTCEIDSASGTLTSSRAGKCVVKATVYADARYAGATTTRTYNMNALAPSAPIIKDASAEGTSIRVSWVEPSSDGGSAVVSYQVTATSADNVYRCSTTGENSCVIANVAEGADYSVVVVASNQSEAVDSGSSASVVVKVPKSTVDLPNPLDPKLDIPTFTPGVPVANPGIGATGDDNAPPEAFDPLTSPEGVKAVTETVTVVTAVIGAIAAAAGAAAAAAAGALGVGAAGAAGAAGAGGSVGGASGGAASGGGLSGRSPASDSQNAGSIANIDVEHQKFKLVRGKSKIRSQWN